MAGNALQVRVNGIQVSRMVVRRQLVDGAPIGKLEVAIEDPVFGLFALDDNENLPAGAPRFIIEMKDMSIPAVDRNKMESKGWKIISVADLLATLQQVGAFNG